MGLGVRFLLVVPEEKRCHTEEAAEGDAQYPTLHRLIIAVSCATTEGVNPTFDS